MTAISCTLLVDDDETTNFLNQALLKRMAVTDNVLVAVNGQEALELLHTHCATPPLPTCPTLILPDAHPARYENAAHERIRVSASLHPATGDR
jgi:hypothetical protein